MKPFELTPEQTDIIHAPQGHYLVTAVAGSGKTTTLAYRIAHLLAKGTDARRLLVLMFNKAAQREFSEKLTQVLPAGSQVPEVRTFHAMAYRFYQHLVQRGHLPAFAPRILQEGEIQLQFWRLAQQKLGPEQGKLFRRNKKEYLELCLRFCDGVKSQLLSAEDYFAAEDYEPEFRWLLTLFHAFEDWRRGQHRISYADMLHEPIKLLQQRPDLVPLLSNKMDQVLVDEYQDTNRIQHEWLKLIAGERAQVMAVGDPDQTIYEFRGARPEYMIGDFLHDFPTAQKRTLSVSFRYGHSVALLANHLIQHNQGRQSILCRAAEHNPQTGIHLHACRDESLQLVRLLRALPESQQEQSAVLLRTWSQASRIELALLQAQLPYRIAAHRSVFQQADFSAIYALLTLAAGSINAPAQRAQCLVQALKFPHAGLNETELQSLAAQASTRQGKLGYALRQVIPDTLKKFQLKKLLRMSEALESIEGSPLPVKRWLDDYTDATELSGAVRNMGLSHEQAAERDASIKALLGYVGAVPGSAQEVITHLDTLRERAQQQSGRGVLLTSIHQAKGLEWPHVMVPGLSKGQLPYQARKEEFSQDLLESERRLLYVAMTRAQQTLHLLSASEHSAQKSSFVEELRFPLSQTLSKALYANDTSLELPLSMAASGVSIRYASAMGFDLKAQALESLPVWRAGRVRHQLFGTGSVTVVEESSFTVVFDNHETRSFAKQQAAAHFDLAVND